jgi:hypothetical protein
MPDEEVILNADVEVDNEEIIDDIDSFDLSSIVVYSRDWTVETLYNQIKIGNIDLNPKFQRRNAWNDEKRSRLIESLLIGYPVPEIVLAENPKKKRSFIVIDGKQRLLTVAGYIDPETFTYWDNQKLSHLKNREDLNGAAYKDLKTNTKYSEDRTAFDNADIRCTVISNYSSTDILYDIFYRLNVGSQPLSTQELRQVLNKGEFADYLIEITNTKQPLHQIMGLNGPDNRLRDVEIILRFISFVLLGKSYNSNLKKFLDDCMDSITKEWSTKKTQVEKIYSDFNYSIEKLGKVFNDTQIGRKYKNGKYETRFNKVLFEVEVFYFMYITDTDLTDAKLTYFRQKFEELCSSNIDFLNTIESSTKNIENYRTRFTLFKKIMNDTFGSSFPDSPVRSESN